MPFFLNDSWKYENGRAPTIFVYCNKFMRECTRMVYDERYLHCYFVSTRVIAFEYSYSFYRKGCSFTSTHVIVCRIEQLMRMPRFARSSIFGWMARAFVDVLPYGYECCRNNQKSSLFFRSVFRPSNNSYRGGGGGFESVVLPPSVRHSRYLSPPLFELT